VKPSYLRRVICILARLQSSVRPGDGEACAVAGALTSRPRVCQRTLSVLLQLHPAAWWIDAAARPPPYRPPLGRRASCLAFLGTSLDLDPARFRPIPAPSLLTERDGGYHRRSFPLRRLRCRLPRHRRPGARTYPILRKLGLAGKHGLPQQCLHCCLQPYRRLHLSRLQPSGPISSSTLTVILPHRLRRRRPHGVGLPAAPGQHGQRVLGS
jgi:hypothetical protein